MSEVFQSAIGSSRDRGDAPCWRILIRFTESYVIQLGYLSILTVPFITNVYPPPLIGVDVSDYIVP
jgi:hypothetical protein